MSCSDPEELKKEKSSESQDMGDVLGKESEEAETEENTVQLIQDINTIAAREDADGAPSSDELTTELNSTDNATAVGEPEHIETLKEEPCLCDACKERRLQAAENLEEMRRLQADWMELRQFIRMVYRTAMEGNRPQHDHQSNIKELVAKLCTNDPHQLFQRLETQVQEFVIEAKVRQLELLKTVNSNNLPAAFISALLDNYKKLMIAADHLVPLLERLQNEHLNKFNISWKLLNQHLFQSFVYTEPLVQNNVPTFISQLGNALAERADTYKKLVREFLSFDDEITLVMGMWRDGEARIHQYNEEQATLKLQQNILKKDWEEFKAHRKLLQKKMWHETASSGEVGSSPPKPGAACSNRGCMCDECTMSQLLSTCGGLVTPPCSPASGSTLTLSNHMEGERVEGEGHEAAGEPATCECHVCTAPPVPTSVELENCSGVLNLHGGGFHLYPHIHGTGGHHPHNIGGDAVAGVYPHLYNLHTSLLANKHAQPPEPTVIMPVIPPEHKQQSCDSKPHVPRPATPPPPPPKRPEHQRSLLKKPGASIVKGASSAVGATNHVHRAGPAPATRPAFNNPAAAHRHSTTQTVAAPNSLAHPRLHPGAVGGDTTVGGGKAVASGGGSCSGGASSHMCHKHGGGEPIKRVPCGGCTGGGGGEEEETSSQEEGDSCSERSTSTQRGGGGGDSRHCDCCYCEVFGHGVPSVAPVSRNFQEMRERLRQLLTKKKAKCKTGGAATIATAPAATPTATAANPTAAYNPAFPTTDTPLPAAGDAVSPQPKDTRALEDLLQFIEGNPNAKCKDEKKAAKKARQKQKKQEELDRKRREEEEEERRQEELRKEEEKRAAALLKVQQQQQAAALAARQKEKKRAKKGQQQQGGKGGSRGGGGEKHQHEHAQQQPVVEGGPQMVTIKRVMEPDSAEPTVTITLRGATPREDKVLYTLLNGQVCKVPKELKNTAKGKTPQHQHQAPAIAPSVQQNKNSGKNKNGSSGGNQQQAVSVHLVQNGNYQHHHHNSVAAGSQHNAKKMNNGVSVSFAKGAKKENQRPPVSTVPPPLPPPPPTQQHSFVPKRVQAPPPSQYARPPAPQPQLTSSAAIQINNAINKLSVRAPNAINNNNNNNFNLNNLKLPPGITITKVDPSTVQRKPIQVKQSTPPAQSTAAPPMSAPSNVIVVDTGRYKTESSYSSNMNNNKDQLDDGKKKKKKKSPVTNGGIFNGNGVGMPMGNGNLLSMVGHPPKPLGRTGHPPPPQNGKVVMPQAAIIKLNGSMVTIRSPALQQALAATDPQTDAKKKKKKKKGPNGQGQPDEWNHLDESVFAPKDIDLENGDIDDAELEIEAFKRFCLQSVPPKRKEKVHFNIKDIVLKKKASAISCS